MDWKEEPTETIEERLSHLLGDIEATVKEAAYLLCILNERRVFHPLMRSPILQFYREIEDETIGVDTVIALGGNKAIVSGIAKLPIPLQTSIADGLLLDVVEVTPEGKQVISRRRVVELDRAALKRVFSETGFRSIDEQKAMIGAEPDVERIDGILIDREKRKLVIGRRQLSPSDLIGPLKALGYTVTKKELEGV